MKLTSNTTKTINGKEVYPSIEVESLPAYFKSSAHNVKLISETKCIWITNDENIISSYDAVFIMYDDNDYIPSTESEFNQAYEAAITNIKNLKNK